MKIFFMVKCGFFIVGRKQIFQKLIGAVVWTAGSIYAK
jgi:hypothetical protein